MNLTACKSRRIAQTAVALGLLIQVTQASAAEPELKLKDGDVWVISGDSITAQRLHSNFNEAW